MHWFMVYKSKSLTLIWILKGLGFFPSVETHNPENLEIHSKMTEKEILQINTEKICSWNLITIANT